MDPINQMHNPIQKHFDIFKQIFAILEQNAQCTMIIDLKEECTTTKKEETQNIIVTNQIIPLTTNKTEEQVTQKEKIILKTMNDLKANYKKEEIRVKKLDKFDTEFYEYFFPEYIPWIYENPFTFTNNSNSILLKLFNKLIGKIDDDGALFLTSSVFKMNLIHLFNFLNTSVNIDPNDIHPKERAVIVLTHMIFEIKDLYKIDMKDIFDDVYRILYESHHKYYISFLTNYIFIKKIKQRFKEDEKEIKELENKLKKYQMKNKYENFDDIGDLFLLESLNIMYFCKKFYEHYENQTLNDYFMKIVLYCAIDLQVMNQQSKTDTTNDITLFHNHFTKHYSQIDKKEEIEKIIQDERNIKLFIKILKSNAIKTYYTDKYESDNIGFIYDEKINDIKYDEDYLKEIPKYIILHSLPENISGITTNFLRISINTSGMQFLDNISQECHQKIDHDCNQEMNQDDNENKIAKEMTEEEKNNATEELYRKEQNVDELLLTCYCLISILHESNHFLRRYFNQNSLEKDIQTERENIISRDGGERMLQYVFNKHTPNVISREGALLLLNYKTWNDVKETKQIFFKKNYTRTIKFMETKEDIPSCCVTRYYPKK